MHGGHSEAKATGCQNEGRGLGGGQGEGRQPGGYVVVPRGTHFVRAVLLTLWTGCLAAPQVTTPRPCAPAPAEKKLIDLLAAGRSASLRGEPAVAQSYFERALALGPEDPGARYGLADALVWRGVVEADAAALERAAELLAGLERTCPDSPGVKNLARLVAMEQRRP